MLEFYEVAELEKKWEEYNKKRQQFSFLKLNSSESNFSKFDRMTVFFIIFIVLVMSVVFWVVFDEKDKEIISKAYLSSVNSTNNSSVLGNKNIVEAKNNLKTNTALLTNSSNNQELSLKLNNIGIKSSEDSAGFTINNNYSQQQTNQNFVNNSFGNQNLPTNANNNIMNSIPKDEIIDFGGAPLPPKSNSSFNPAKVSNFVTNQSNRITNSNVSNASGFDGFSQPRPKRDLSNKIIIKSVGSKDSGSNFSSSDFSSDSSGGDIKQSLSMAQRAYNKGDYDSAIKWSLESNEIDENNAESWVIFAKANFKKGKVDDALYALETFNKKKPSKNIENLISKMRSGHL